MAHQYYSLKQAKAHKSRTMPYAFVIAHECHEPYIDREGENKVRTRDFIAFDDVESFLAVRVSFPHSHEVIYDRFTSTQQGRLMFDFDFDEPWHGLKPHFVPPDFQHQIEQLIVATFDTYYQDVDTSKFVFIWLISDVVEKWSKHLIVKHAFFADDWRDQTQVFYQLMLGLAEDQDLFRLSTEKLIDAQVARTNATMRMCGSSKMSGKVLELESPLDANFYDTLVQLFRREDIKAEQHIHDDQLRKQLLDDMYYKDRAKTNEYYKEACLKADIDLTRQNFKFASKTLDEETVKWAFECFEAFYCAWMDVPRQDVFHILNATGGIINLAREKPSPCMLSKRVHNAENAFLTVHDKSKVYFHCRRECKHNGYKSMLIVDTSDTPTFRVNV